MVMAQECFGFDSPPLEDGCAVEGCVHEASGDAQAVLEAPDLRFSLLERVILVHDVLLAVSVSSAVNVTNEGWLVC
jgi:hypothetical protein